MSELFERGAMIGAKTLTASLFLAVVALGCVACGSSGAQRSPEARQRTEDRLQRCPEHESDHPDNENPDAKKTLVPAGAGSALICLYRGRRTAGPSAAPEAKVLHAGSSRFRRLVHAFGQLDPVRRGAVACPTGRPLRYLVAFHYRNQGDDYVRVDLNGCGLVTNNVLKTLFYPSERLRRILR